MQPEHLLCTWVNYIYPQANLSRFSENLSDGNVFINVLATISNTPETLFLLREPDIVKRIDVTIN